MHVDETEVMKPPKLAHITTTKTEKVAIIWIHLSNLAYNINFLHMRPSSLILF